VRMDGAKASIVAALEVRSRTVRIEDEDFIGLIDAVITG
jgi:hypothetical protein